MPATTASYEAAFGSFKHVNLMIDTYIANAPASDLRAVIRALLSTLPSAGVQFNRVVRARLKQSLSKYTLPSQNSLFVSRAGRIVPTQHFTEILSHARMLFGAGLGIDSLPMLTCIVRATVPLRWTETDDLPSHLATVDGDISQAIQSCTEEVTSGFLQSQDDLAAARAAVEELYRALEESRRQVDAWGGDFPFDRGCFAVEHWRCSF